MATMYPLWAYFGFVQAQHRKAIEATVAELGLWFRMGELELTDGTMRVYVASPDGNILTEQQRDDVTVALRVRSTLRCGNRVSKTRTVRAIIEGPTVD